MLVFGFDIPVMEVLFYLLVFVIILFLVLLAFSVFNFLEVRQLNRLLVIERDDITLLEKIVNNLEHFDTLSSAKQKDVVESYIDKQLDNGFLSSEILDKLVKAGHDKNNILARLKKVFTAKFKTIVAIVEPQLKSSKNIDDICADLKKNGHAEVVSIISDYYKLVDPR